MVTQRFSSVSEPDDIEARRRDFHKYAEPGWCEVRTASLIARKMHDLGFVMQVGDEVLSHERMGLPTAAEMNDAMHRALSQGADVEFARRMSDGYTGLVGTIRGDRPGPRIGLRFDIDANYGVEAGHPHPATEAGYASINTGVHHSCGHDGHAAIGLAVAERVAAARDRIRGEVRLIFQPAEEGLRGGAAMVRRGVADNLDFLVGCHLGVQARETGQIIAGYTNILGSVKFDVMFSGRSAHAGISPQDGRNAIQAAAVTVQNLLAISRHGAGETRVNIGRIEGGETRNSIPAIATLKAEVRGDSDAIVEHMMRQVTQVVEGAADMCGVHHRIDIVGGAGSASSDLALAKKIERVARTVAGVTSVQQEADFKGSDDISCFMNAVQNNGGEAAYFGLGSTLTDLHHSPGFDIDDSALPIGLEVFCALLTELGSMSPDRADEG